MEGWVVEGDEKCLGQGGGVKKTVRFAVIDCSIVLTLAKFDWLKDQRTLQPISGHIHNSSMIGGGHPSLGHSHSHSYSYSAPLILSTRCAFLCFD